MPKYKYYIEQIIYKYIYYINSVDYTVYYGIGGHLASVLQLFRELTAMFTECSVTLCNNVQL